MTIKEYLIVAAAIGFMALAVWADAEKNRQWKEFARDHECRKIEEISGATSIGYGIASNGQGGMITTYTPGKTGWACNDGVTYWREE
ncbi:hypothetical protein KS461_09895 [Pseudomonas chlororaphis]|uniref:hypothetical protein n=1 Tax=Pseudomonas chlororaphis TaxID=587753 RepID=UPI00215A2E99|nr:hypothetical protein [Pseudomonas chlororaphis]UVE47575.1 hypothetical protein KS461_09895 [Pseudomonas chlororaphis]